MFKRLFIYLFVFVWKTDTFVRRTTEPCNWPTQIIAMKTAINWSHLRDRLGNGFSMCVHFCVNKTHMAEVTMGKESLQVILENVCWQRKGWFLCRNNKHKKAIDVNSYPEEGWSYSLSLRSFERILPSRARKWNPWVVKSQGHRSSPWWWQRDCSQNQSLSRAREKGNKSRHTPKGRNKYLMNFKYHSTAVSHYNLPLGSKIQIYFPFQYTFSYKFLNLNKFFLKSLFSSFWRKDIIYL